MGQTLSYGFGWGVKLDDEKQTILSNRLLEIIAGLDETHPFQESVWYTLDINEFFLVDVLEDLFEDQIEIYTVSNDEIIVFAKHALVSNYNDAYLELEAKPTASETLAHNLQLLKPEENIIEGFCKSINRETSTPVSPNWYLYASHS